MIVSLYRLFPTARRGDTNWRRATDQGEILVRARSGGEARALAARAEAQAAGASPKITTQVLASAFYDPNLYGVRREDSSAFEPDGPLGVLEGTFQTPPGYLVLHED